MTLSQSLGVVALVVAVVAELAVGAQPELPRMLVLSPIGSDHTVDTRTRELRIRRICRDDRCQLFVGRAHEGFRLVASYQGWETLALDRRGELIRIGEPYVESGIPQRNMLWFAASGCLALACFFVAHRGRLKRREEHLQYAQEGVIDEHGDLIIAGIEHRARSLDLLPAGHATVIGRTTGAHGDGPFRETPVHTYIACEGSPLQNAARAAAARGRIEVLISVIVALGAACAVVALLGP